MAVAASGRRLADRTDHAIFMVRMGGGSAARLDGAEVVLSFARVIGADILRSGGGAHASYFAPRRNGRGGRVGLR